MFSSRLLMRSLFDTLILNTRESTPYDVLRMLACKEHPMYIYNKIPWSWSSCYSVFCFVFFFVSYNFFFWRIINYPQIVPLFLHSLYKISAVLVFRKHQKNSYKLLKSKQVLNVKNDYTIAQHLPAKTISHHS